MRPGPCVLIDFLSWKMSNSLRATLPRTAPCRPRALFSHASNPCLQSRRFNGSGAIYNQLLNEPVVIITSAALSAAASADRLASPADINLV